MRLLIWIIFIIGAPFYLLNELTTGKWDGGTTAIVLGLFGLSIAAIAAEYRRGQARRGQEDFWRSQRK